MIKVSLFKPWIFGTTPSAPVYASSETEPTGSAEARSYWLQAEAFRRSLLGKALPPQFYTELAKIQQAWLIEARRTSNEDFPAFSAWCLSQEKAFYEKWAAADIPAAPSVSRSFLKRWEKKNAVLEKK